MQDLFKRSMKLHSKTLELEEKIKEFNKYKISSINYSDIKLSSANKHLNTLDDVLIIQEELLNKYIRAYTDELEVQMQIEKYLDTLKEPMERLIIRGRYICYLPWNEISDKTGYSLRQVMRIHKKILDSLDKEADK